MCAGGADAVVGDAAARADAGKLVVVSAGASFAIDADYHCAGGFSFELLSVVNEHWAPESGLDFTLAEDT